MTTSKTIVLWAPIELADGVDEDTLLQASENFQDNFVSKQKGFISRQLLKGQDGKWVDLVFWEGKENVEQLLKNEESSTVCHEFFKLMKVEDPNDPGFLQFELVKTYK